MSALLRFASLLDRHLSNGSRPGKTSAEPWTNVDFAKNVTGTHDKGSDFVSDRSVANWRKGQALPSAIEPILNALFGTKGFNPSEREELRQSYLDAKRERANKILAQTEPDPAGATWVARDDQFIIDRSAQSSDVQAAADPLIQQQQMMLRIFTADLVEETRRLGNSPTWSRLHPAAYAFLAIVNENPQQVPQHLGSAYGWMLRLGRCLETHKELETTPDFTHSPLDPVISASLRDVVRIGAPWLRNFPTAAKWDDEAGKMLGRPDMYKPALNFTRIARAKLAISEDDAREIDHLAETAASGGVLGGKSNARTVATANNLLIAGAAVVEPQAASTLAKRALETLVAAEKDVAALAADQPAELRDVLLSVIESETTQNIIKINDYQSTKIDYTDEISENNFYINTFHWNILKSNTNCFLPNLVNILDREDIRSHYISESAIRAGIKKISTRMIDGVRNFTAISYSKAQEIIFAYMKIREEYAMIREEFSSLPIIYERDIVIAPFMLVNLSKYLEVANMTPAILAASSGVSRGAISHALENTKGVCGRVSGGIAHAIHNTLLPLCPGLPALAVFADTSPFGIKHVPGTPFTLNDLLLPLPRPLPAEWRR
ncbi:hypothetical protein GCM10017653_31730 [Ancylobacter defluvii]|uniref:Uncharacterized protein n=1 Tax=Ancylobacter defluvii TaxID=1282440 RepID=A0A9W6K192_9HYPH|nr:hypothetical protein GCM10017653_31730 [Ancylobacter defluvii]